MDAFTALVIVVAIALVYRVILVALHSKGDLRAAAKVGMSSFFVEVREKEASRGETLPTVPHTTGLADQTTGTPAAGRLGSFSASTEKPADTNRFE